MTTTLRRTAPSLGALVLLLAGGPAAAQPTRQAPPPTEAPVATPPPAPEPAEPRSEVLEALRPVSGGWTADSAVAKALSRSPMVRRALASQRQADAGASRASRTMWPRLDLSARYTRISEVDQPPFEFEIGGITQSFDNPFPQILDNYALRASLTVPVSDIFLTIGPSAEGARHMADAARFQADGQREAVASQVRSVFYGLVGARGATIVARESVGLLESFVRDLRELAQAGVTARTDVVRAEAQLASARVGLARATGAVQSTETILRRLLGLPEGAPVLLGEDLTTPPRFQPPAEASLVARAMRQRAEARALRALIAGRESFVSARRASQWPRFVLAANLDVANPNQRIVPSVEEFRATWDASAIAQWSPNDLALNDRAVVEARAELEQARRDLEAFEDGVAIETAQAVAEYSAASQAIGAATEGVAAAGESYRSRRELLAAGSTTASEVLEAQTQLARSQLELLQALVGERLARARLQQVVGESAPRQGESR